jgi:hypothetical protein
MEAALAGPPRVAAAAAFWAYWLGGADGRRLLGLGSRVAPGGARERAADLLAELG